MKKIFVLFLFSLVLFNGCKKNSHSDSKINLIASTFPCYDAARAVLGDLIENGSAELTLLVKPGTEVHSFDPNPKEIIQLSKCDLFIFVGGESDEWIERLNINLPEEKMLRLMDSVKLLNETENPNEIDEHVWTSPENEIQIIQAVKERLLKNKWIQSEEEIAEKVQENAASYQNLINETAEKTKKLLNSKSEKFIVMADRFPFTYFADFYHLEYDAAFSGCSTAVEASTATISRLIDEVKTKNLPCVFYIELGNHKIADSIAESTGTKAVLLQSVQNLTKDDFENGETWISLMNRNIQALDNLK